MRTMAVDALVRCRVDSETKTLLQTIAAREQITESALIQQLLETLVMPPTTENPMPTPGEPQHSR